MKEPLHCCKCGAYDNDCSCGWPDEETPQEEYNYCEVCGSQLENHARCPECEP